MCSQYRRSGAMWRVLHLVACVKLAVTINNTQNTEKTNNTNANELLISIRRQLMDQNYEYMSQESDDNLPHLTSTEPTPQTKTAARRDAVVPHVDDIYLTYVGLSRPVQDVRRTTTNVLRDDVVEVDKKDLQFLNETRSNIREFAQKAETTTARVKYKFFKVQHPSYRRSGSQRAYRRFIQEEGSDGVAIISLDNEAFPEFRLPRARRQYMTDDELELADVTDVSAGLDGNNIDDTTHELARNRAV